jgi:integrase
MPIHPELRVALEDFWRHHLRQPLDPESYLFEGNRRGRPISTVQAWRMFTKACREVGIYERVALHSLRKTFAKEVHAVTRDLFKTQAILGHKSPLTTIAYLEPLLDDLDAIVCGLGHPAPAALSA